jgi:hypothetical protein
MDDITGLPIPVIISIDMDFCIVADIGKIPAFLLHEKQPQNAVVLSN